MPPRLDAAVILAGGGPCGLMLANELGRRGVATLLFDEKPSTSPYPQANATQARTMEHYRRLGFADAVRAEGLPTDHPTDIAYFTRIARHELARFALPASGKARDLIRQLRGSWSAAELPHRCSQMYIERILREEAEKLPSVALNFGWRVTGFAESDTHVEVAAESVDSKTARRFTAHYLVGCDGPGSLVRKQLGFRYAGESGVQRDFLGGRMLSLYFRAPDLHRIAAGPRAWQYWAVNREQRGVVSTLDGKGDFVAGFQLKPGENESAITPARGVAMLQRALGAEIPVEVLNHSFWTAGFTLVAERFQLGRVFLAGDAVHLFTPTGGLGYNTAVEDAVNLGWKLAATINGWGGPRLLASYQAERQPAARRNTDFARRFADSIGRFVPAAEIEEESEAGTAARREAGAYLERHARAEFDIPGITFGGRYDQSPLIVADGSVPPPDDANLYVPSACPGGRAPHAWLGERSLFDALGFEFTLLRLGAKPPCAEALIRAAAAHGVPLAVLDLGEEVLRDLYAADFALIRPDQIVAWRGNRVPEDAAELIARVAGLRH